MKGVEKRAMKRCRKCSGAPSSAVRLGVPRELHSGVSESVKIATARSCYGLVGPTEETPSVALASRWRTDAHNSADGRDASPMRECGGRQTQEMYVSRIARLKSLPWAK